ncbi:MAG: nucleoside permease [Planctomycetes bacterium]|nr:nucleoside permease [Planctomycetota bacterium]
MNQSQSSISIRLSIMMFLQFFIWGSWYVTVGNYMAAHGMSDEIKWAYSVGPMAAIVTPFILGMIADRFFATERVLGVLQIVGGLCLCAAPLVVTGAEGNNATLFILLLLAHMVCYMPTLGLTNTLAFSHIEDQEKQFPLIRVFGTIGWIVAGVLVSKVLHADSTQQPLWIAGGAAILMGFYSFSLPHTPPPSKGKDISIRDILCLDAMGMLKDSSFLVFMLSSLLICIPLAAYYAYAPVYVGQVGFADPAFNMSFGQMSEIVFMLIMPMFFKRLGVKKMLVIGMLAWVVRYGLFAAGAPDGILWMVLTGIALHGICYDFFFVTGQIYVDKAAPSKIRGQAQGLLVLVTQGIGMLVGAQASGWIYVSFLTESNTLSPELWQQFWGIPCIMAAIILVLFALMFKEQKKALD